MLFFFFVDHGPKHFSSLFFLRISKCLCVLQYYLSRRSLDRPGVNFRLYNQFLALCNTGMAKKSHNIHKCQQRDTFHYDRQNCHKRMSKLFSFPEIFSRVRTSVVYWLKFRIRSGESQFAFPVQPRSLVDDCRPVLVSQAPLSEYPVG